jgi:hypothetical protein
VAVELESSFASGAGSPGSNPGGGIPLFHRSVTR